MKKLFSVAAAMAVYVLFLFSFSFFDNIRFIDRTLFLLKLKHITKTTSHLNIKGSDPMPPPPYPPPPPPPDDDGDG